MGRWVGGWTGRCMQLVVEVGSHDASGRAICVYYSLSLRSCDWSTLRSGRPSGGRGVLGLIIDLYI